MPYDLVMMKVWSFLFGSLIVFSAQAQTINSHGFRFSDTLESVGMEDALGLSSELIQSNNPFLFRASFDYARDSLSATDLQGANFTSFVDHLYSVSVGVSAVLHPRILVGFSAPLHFVQLSSAYVSGQFDESAWKMGDMSVHAKLRLTSDQSKINVAIRPHLSIPTGSNPYFVSNDSFGMGGRLIADMNSGRWKWMAHAGYSYASKAEFVSIDHQNLVDAGVGFFYRINQKFGWNAEWLQSISVPTIEGGQNPTQVNLGIRYDTGTTKVFAGGGVQGFEFNNGSRPFMFFAGIKHPFGAKKSAEPTTSATAMISQSIEDSEMAKTIETIQSMVVYFDNNRAKIKSEHHDMLNQAAKLIMENNIKIHYLVLHGHSDPRGDVAYNKQLSQRRAQVVKEYLVVQGVNEHAILIDGYGETSPKTTSEKDYRTNRRVEFQVMKK